MHVVWQSLGFYHMPWSSKKFHSALIFTWNFTSLHFNFHLKRKFGSNKIEKVIYFSDGAGSQHKNKFNLVNLINREREFKIKDEWIIFATSDGKEACDGIGGTVKRHTIHLNPVYKTIISRRRNSSMSTLREILLVVLTKRSQLYIFSKQYQKCCECY